MKLLQRPVGEWKYIGVLSWAQLSAVETILLSELELIVVSALDMYDYFKRITQILTENTFGEFPRPIKGQTVHSLKLQCTDVGKLLTDPKYEFSKVEDFPHILGDRDVQQNTELIQTAIVLFKMGYLSKEEIKNSIDLYEQHTAAFQSNGIQVNDPVQLKELIKGMRAINKVMSPWFIRDWCLKSFKFLRRTSVLVFNNSLAIGRSPSKARLSAKVILDAIEVESYEFLCLMANAFNRQ